jgi:hypothetical protein
VDAVNQFQVQTAGYSAQYQGQGVENYSIKTGGNKYHGSIYEYFRNTALDAWQFTSKVPTLNGAGVLVPGGIKPRENQNEYGIVLSGPIVKDKLFLFYNYGQYREAHGPTIKQQNMPTTAMLNGDFSGWATSTGYPIYDPASQTCTAGNTSCTRKQFMGMKNGLPTPNVIPASNLSAASVYYNKLYVPYEALTNQNAYSNNIATGYSSGLSNWYQTGRLDYHASDKNQIGIIVAFGRQASTGPNSVGAVNQLGPPFNTGQAYAPQTTVDIVEDTYTINSHMVNQFRYGFGRYRSASVTPNRTPAFAAETAGLTGTPPGQATDGFPGIAFSTTSATSCPPGGPGINNLCSEGGYAWNTKASNTYTLVDNFQWELGKHNLTIGAQMEWLQYNYLQVATASGPMNYTFTNTETSAFQAGTTKTVATTGSSFASYDLGAVDSANVKALIPELGMRYRDPSFYVQDDYKVTSKLMINLGLRWDIYPPLQEAHNLFSFLNPTQTNPITGNLGTLNFAGNGNSSTYCNCKSPVPTWYKNIGPRLGLAYSLDEKTVIRSSFGIAYTHGDDVGGTSATGPSQLGITPSATAPTGNFSAPAFYWDNSPCTAGVANGSPCGFTGAITTPPISNTYVTGNTVALGKASTGVAYYDSYLGSRAPEYINWSVGFQRQITNDIAATVTYVGSQGHFEPSNASARGLYSNQLPLSFAALGTVYATGTTNPLLTAASTPANIAQAVSLGFKVPNGYGSGSSPYYASNSVYQYFVQFPQYSSISDYASHVANSNFHAFEISLKQRESHGMTFMLNYTYSKSIDDGGTIRQGYNDRLDRSLSTTDQPQNLTSTVVYKLPFGHGKIGGDNYWANAFGGGWSLSGIFIYHSGYPLVVVGSGCGGGGILSQCMPSLNTNFSGPVRINGGYNVHRTATTYSTVPYVNAAAFTVANLAPTPTVANSGPAFYQPGNAARVGALNLWGQGLYNLDLGIKRTFKIYENVNLQFEADLLNATNHVVFSGPATTVSATSWVNGAGGGIGTNTGNTFGQVSSVANTARDAQLSARINF